MTHSLPSRRPLIRIDPKPVLFEESRPIDLRGYFTSRGGTTDSLESRFVCDADALDSLVEILVSEPVYAIDTEFHRERSYYPRVGLIQLAWTGGMALVDPLAVSPKPLADVLHGPGVAIFHAAEQDLLVLDRACGALPTRIYDTQVAAQFLGMATPSLSNLVETVLGIEMKKDVQLTDWMERPLAAHVLAYAAGDVCYLLELERRLSAALSEAGRKSWAEEEFERLLLRPRADSDPAESWWKIRHARQLKGSSRGVAQEVAAWRERQARAFDIPLRSLIPDLALAALAQRPPQSLEDLRSVRGIEARHLSGGAGEEILEAIAAGVDLPPELLKLPEPEHGGHIKRSVLALVTAFLSQWAAELELDPTLLATKADLIRFLAATPSGRLAEGWRNELLGEALTRLADGEAALAIDGIDGLVVEERSHRPVSWPGMGRTPRGGHDQHPLGLVEG
jgi:ribonuclease D